MEFNYAPNGIIGLETAWAVTNEQLLAPGHLDLRSLIDKLCDQPRKILRLQVPKIEPGCGVNLTIFNTDEQWVFDDKNVRSKSHNSPYLNRKMTGRAMAIVNKGLLHINTPKVGWIHMIMHIDMLKQFNSLLILLLIFNIQNSHSNPHAQSVSTSYSYSL